MKLFILLPILCLFHLLNFASALKVICYYQSWSSTFAPEDIDVSICTHINFAFVGITADGQLRLDGDDAVIRRLVGLKSRNPSLKVLLSVGGWNEGATTFSQVAADAGKKANLAGSMIWWMKNYNLDGLDIDWEYPGQRGGTPADKENFIDMLWVLRNSINANGGRYLLTIAASSDPTPTSYNVNAIYRVVDSINIMTYDFHSAADGRTGQNSPLFAAAGESEWQRAHLNVAGAVSSWLGGGAAADKVTLGLAFYGRGFRLADPNQHGVGAATVGEGDFGTPTYVDVCRLAGGGWTEVWDDVQKVPYKYGGGNWIGFDNARSIGLKVQYAKSRGLAGVIIWSVDQDDKNGVCGGGRNPLLGAVRSNL